MTSAAFGRVVFWIGIGGLAWLVLSALLAPLRVSAAGLDPPSQALDATATLWAFFSTHRV